MAAGRIIRVELEFSNKIYIVTGKRAKEWSDRVASMETLASTHFGSQEFKWSKILEKPRAKQKKDNVD